MSTLALNAYLRNLARAKPEYHAVIDRVVGDVGGPDARGGSAVGPALDPSAYVTTARLVDDTRRLLEILPPDVDLVVGIARSGLLPGSILAFLLHLPLRAVSRWTGVSDPGRGIRLADDPDFVPRHVLLVDDTVATGREMAACGPIVASAWPEARITRAAVYAHPQARGEVDLCVSLYPGFHYLEWNWANSGHGRGCGFDFDGVLCHDCPIEDDDDGPRYAAFLRDAPPLHLPRRSPVPLIVTARHERYRGPTLAWLDRRGVVAERLVMRDWDFDPARPWDGQVGEWKADHYRASACHLFAESTPAQAEIIAARSGKPVLCPELGRVIVPPRLDNTHQGRARAKIEADRAWFIALPTAVKEAVRDCVHRKNEPNRRCCGGDSDVCRGGARDGVNVDTIACARCRAVAAGIGQPDPYVKTHR